MKYRRLKIAVDMTRQMKTTFSRKNDFAAATGTSANTPPLGTTVTHQSWLYRRWAREAAGKY